MPYDLSGYNYNATEPPKEDVFAQTHFARQQYKQDPWGNQPAVRFLLDKYIAQQEMQQNLNYQKHFERQKAELAAQEVRRRQEAARAEQLYNQWTAEQRAREAAELARQNAAQTIAEQAPKFERPESEQTIRGAIDTGLTEGPGIINSILNAIPEAFMNWITPPSYDYLASQMTGEEQQQGWTQLPNYDNPITQGFAQGMINQTPMNYGSYLSNQEPEPRSGLPSFASEFELARWGDMRGLLDRLDEQAYLKDLLEHNKGFTEGSLGYIPEPEIPYYPGYGGYSYPSYGGYDFPEQAKNWYEDMLQWRVL